MIAYLNSRYSIASHKNLIKTIPNAPLNHHSYLTDIITVCMDATA